MSKHREMEFSHSKVFRNAERLVTVLQIKVPLPTCFVMLGNPSNFFSLCSSSTKVAEEQCPVKVDDHRACSALPIFHRQKAVLVRGLEEKKGDFCSLGS